MAAAGCEAPRRSHTTVSFSRIQVAFLELLQHSTGTLPQPARPYEPVVGDHPVPIPLHIPSTSDQSRSATPALSLRGSLALSCKQHQRRGVLAPCVQATVAAWCPTSLRASSGGYGLRAPTKGKEAAGAACKPLASAAPASPMHAG
jgi:hypothetical protein